jgi:ATPase
VDMKSDQRAIVWVDDGYVPQLIGKRGKNIEEIEKKVGISLGVESREVKKTNERPTVLKKEKKIGNPIAATVPVNVELSGNYVVLNFGKETVGTPFDILVDEDYLFTATVGKKGTIKIKKDIELAEIILNAQSQDLSIKARIRTE